MKHNYLLKIFFLFCSFVSVDFKAVASTQLNQAQTHLKKMQQEIASIKQKIHSKQKTHSSLQQLISEKNQAIKAHEQKKQALMNKINILEAEVTGLKKQLTVSKTLITQLQNQVYEHLNLHLQLVRKPYWQVIFSTQNPFEYYQRVDLYQYLYQSEQKNLGSLKKQEDQLRAHQQNLTYKIDDLHHLKNLIEAQVQTINLEKNKEKAQLGSVQSEIAQDTAQLQTIEKNQAQLKTLIQQLLKENQLQSTRSFTLMKNKLKYPVNLQHPLITHSQNGIIFHAPENTKVHAVANGKVVFADWLNGYGYLVIVDHGWGFMTLYGNNHQLLRHKGDNVHLGDEIATVGKSGAFKQTGLYFEIRQKARVVSALNWFRQKAA
jgi:murein hydrolase activator